MAVETGDYPSVLDYATYGPTGADDPTEGDNHILLLKRIIETTFGACSGAVTATHTELNKLSGCTATTAELNILDGVTSTTAELNILDGVTSTAAELNYLDVATLGTSAASKAIVADASANVDNSAVTWTNLGAVTTADINGGTVDGAVIGGTSAAAITGTTVTANTSLTIAGTTTVSSVLDEDTMSSDSATALATQQSIKAYVDSKTEDVIITNVIADVSTAETILIPVPVTGTVTAVYSVLEGAITVADATVTLVTSADAAMASLTIAFTSSAAGDVDSDTSITNASVTAGDYLKLATDGGSTTAQRLWVTIVVNKAVG